MHKKYFKTRYGNGNVCIKNILKRECMHKNYF